MGLNSDQQRETVSMEYNLSEMLNRFLVQSHEGNLKTASYYKRMAGTRHESFFWERFARESAVD